MIESTYAAFRTLALGLVLAQSALSAAAGDVSFRYFRFTPVELRNTAAANSVQLAELQLLYRGAEVAGASASNPGGANPGSEKPSEAVDGDISTKWLDFNKGSLVLDFGKPVVADNYVWATANDALARDPVRWRFEGSLDGDTWSLLDDQTRKDYPTPETRFAFLPPIGFNQVPDSPVIRAFVVRHGALVSENGVAITSGTTVSLEWEVADAEAVGVAPGAPNSAENPGSLEVSPKATTTYTLTAVNDAGTSSAQVTVYVDIGVGALLINEILADSTREAAALRDEDGDPSDWIEIFNPNATPVDLGGHCLTDDASDLTQWRFPPATPIEPGGFLVVFASGKDRAVTGSELHAGFKLAREGEYLALTQPDGVTILDTFAPGYPEQHQDISYGKDPANAGNHDYFVEPTPGARNSTITGLPLLEEAGFSRESTTFVSAIDLSLSTPLPETSIRYTTDGTIPTAASHRFSGTPLSLTRTTQVRARLFQSGYSPGPVTSRTFTKLTSDVASFSSDLPIIILDNLDGKRVPSGRELQPGVFTLVEPGETGRTSLNGPLSLSHRIGIKRRGSSTLNDPKGNYRLEFWGETDGDAEAVELLGLSRHNEWILFAPYRFDRSLVRIPFIHQLSLNIGRYASRSVFVEVFLSTDSGAVSESDYQGVYVLQERISRDADRVSVARLDETDLEEPVVSGGYILSIDRLDPEDRGFRTALGHPEDPAIAGPQPWFNYVYPKEQDILPEQAAYIQRYLDDYESVLYGPDFAHPQAGYADWIDIGSFVDHHILVVLTKDPDALRLSTFFHKDREGKLAAGPIWDFDRTMGCDGDGRSSNPQGWDPPNETAQFFLYDWWGRLFEDPEFWQAWIDRWQTLRQHEMRNASLTGLVDHFAAQVVESQRRNFARWPETSPNGGSLSSLSGWEGEIDHLRHWLRQRADWIDRQFPAMPQFNRESGAVSPGFEVTIDSADHAAYYTTDGSDPRAFGGGVSPSATLMNARGTTWRLTETTTVTTRTFDGTNWSAPVKRTYVVGRAADASNLIVSEVHYRPAPPSEAERLAGFAQSSHFEFIELRNTSADIIDMTGVRLADGVEFEFAISDSDPVRLDPGERIVIANDPAAFSLRYADRNSDFQLVGPFGGNLDNDGERILLVGAGLAEIRDFTYNDQPPWPTAADGEGCSLTLIHSAHNPTPDHAAPSNWRSSVLIGGTPGGTDAWPYEGDPLADANGNGIADLVDHALATSSNNGGSLPLPSAFQQTSMTDGALLPYLVYSYRHNLAADDVLFEIETSRDLIAWQPGDKSLVYLDSINHGDGTATVSYRTVGTTSTEPCFYIRLKLTHRP